MGYSDLLLGVGTTRHRRRNRLVLCTRTAVASRVPNRCPDCRAMVDPNDGHSLSRIRSHQCAIRVLFDCNLWKWPLNIDGRLLATELAWNVDIGRGVFACHGNKPLFQHHGIHREIHSCSMDRGLLTFCLLDFQGIPAKEADMDCPMVVHLWELGGFEQF